jgi:hypothetical protein
MVTIPTEMARTASQFRHVDVRIIDAEGHRSSGTDLYMGAEQ